MSIKNVQPHPIHAGDPAARERTIQNVRSELHRLTREYGSAEAARQIAQTYSVVPTLAEVAEAERDANATRYAELRQSAPFSAIEFAKAHPEVYGSQAAQGETTAALRRAQFPQGRADDPRASIASVFEKAGAHVATPTEKKEGT